MTDEPLRSSEQNRKFHAMLEDIPKQVKWAGLYWDKDSWKALVLGAKYGQIVAPNPFGHGLLVMGAGFATMKNTAKCWQKHNGRFSPDLCFSGVCHYLNHDIGGE